MGTQNSKTSNSSSPSTEDGDDEKNLEIFSLVWLDKDVNRTDDNLQIQEQLRETAINYLRTFDNIGTCEQWIRRRQLQDDKIILIVSGSYGKEIVPCIYNLPKLIAIYIYCHDKLTHEQWSQNYKDKVCGVITDSDELVDRITKDQTYFEKLEETTSMFITTISNPSSSNEKSSSKLNGNFLWSQLLIEVLLHMKHTTNNRRELIKLCQQMYVGNAGELQTLKEFERTYSPEKAIWWYTKQSFVYRMLNKALRTQDIDVLVAFRFFITDLYNQLQELHQKQNRDTIRRVYRGQLMSKYELDQMKSINGQYLSLNSFLSTTLNREVAVEFITTAPVTDDLIGVLFEIDIDPKIKNIKPYANISFNSFFQTEAEVLFMLGSIFKNRSITQKGGITIIKLQLASENNSELKQLSDYMKSNLEKERNLYSLGHVLIGMGEYAKGSKCFKRQLSGIENKNSGEAGLCYT
ncbi:unnamed protein product, partial [Didymodactylos carnosus]